MLGTVAFAALAGILSTLSPCVLPILPIVLAAAVLEHRYGPIALGAGVALSFTVLGIFVATIGFSLGLDAGVFRIAAAILLMLLGAVMLVPRLQQGFAVAAAPIGNWTETRFGGFSTGGLGGQFGVGLLLGAVWSPCAGPTLGAASIAAANTQKLGPVVATMAAFGIGAALPLLGLGLLSRAAIMRWRDRLRAASEVLKPILGAALVAAGIFIVTGLDRSAETALVDASPAWLTTLTTRF